MTPASLLAADAGAPTQSKANFRRLITPGFKYMPVGFDNRQMTPNIHRAASPIDVPGNGLIEPIAHSEYELVSALREGTWQLLDRYLHRTGTKPDASVIVGLQDAANRLGAVERLLEELHVPRTSVAAAA